MRFCIALSVTLLMASEIPVCAQDAAGSDDRATSGPAEANFFVAPDGDDKNPGTIEKPFQSLERARDAVRDLKRSETVDGPLVVMLRGGTYRFSRSVVFSDQDSGTAQSPITYKAYPGEQPIFSGGMPVADWKGYKDQILSAVLPNVENQYYRFRQLFLNGKRQIRARYPNFDQRHPHLGGWAFIESTDPVDAPAPTSFHWEDGLFPRRWAKPELGEIYIIPGLAWNSHIIPIRSADHDQRLITISRELSQIWDKLHKGNRFYVENLLEELDQPGEWCFDSETNTLYFWPPSADSQPTEVTVPITDRLIELRSTAGSPVRHLRFSGLTFTQTLSVFPNPIPKHPDYVDCNRPNSAGYAFYMENTEHCSIEDCRFDQVGGDAIRLHNFCAHNRIVGNEIVGAGAQGICLADLDFWPYDFPPIWRENEKKIRSMSGRLPWAKGNVISRNHIHHSGVIDAFGAGIHLHGFNCQDNVISHNLIHDMPHHAIYLSMGFGRNIIEYNDLHKLCLVMADAGGVYCNRWCILEGDQTLGENNIIRYNRIRDVQGVAPHAKEVSNPGDVPSEDRIQTPHFTWGIYFDNSPRRAQVYGNLTIGNVWGGVYLGGGYSEPADCLVENNILVNSSVYQFDLTMNEPARGNRFVRNIVYYQNPEAALFKFRTNEGIAECDYNLYFQADGKQLRLVGVPDESWEQWREMGFDSHSLVEDPLFVDPEAGDYRLKPDSPALKLGFKPIPFERIGIQGKE